MSLPLARIASPGRSTGGTDEGERCDGQGRGDHIAGYHRRKTCAAYDQSQCRRLRSCSRPIAFFANTASAGANCALAVFTSMPANRHALVQAELVLSNAVFDRQLLANARFAVAQAGQRGNPGFATARSWRMSVESLAHE